MRVQKAGATALQAAAAIGLCTVAYSAYLGYISSVKIKAYCLYCISLYVVNLGFTICALLAGPRTPGKAIDGAFGALFTFRNPVPNALGVLILASILSVAGFQYAEVSLEQSYWATVKGKRPPVTPRPGTAAAPKAPAAAPASAAAKVGPTGARPRPTGTRRANFKRFDLTRIHGEGQKSDDGWSIFHWPLDEEREFWYGNPDAKVTVVKVADFQCSYCRFLAASMKPVKEKYKDRVRFVMRNFPMNFKCNRAMRGYDKHPNACEAALAGFCAGEQGKFWEMYDAMYADQEALDEASLRKTAQRIGLNLGDYDACMADPRTMAYIKQDIEVALRAGIYGTPKTYINGRLITGSATQKILEYNIELALREVAQGGLETTKKVRMAPKGDGTQMVQAKKASGAFWIDPYEASITKDGKAVSVPGVKPARANFYQAKDACEKAGKRLCTEEEWVSACTGTPAIDDNNNQYFSDDTIEGNMYPYGPFYKAGTCRDDADRQAVTTVPTGSRKDCRTPSAIFDLTGNIEEWVSHGQGGHTMGGHAAAGQGASCNRRSYAKGLGRRNQTTGFRCCADSNVTRGPVAAADLVEEPTSLLGHAVPSFEVKTNKGTTIRSKDFKGRVTLVNFFASWCGPCKKELPYLVKYYAELHEKGFDIVGIGVDDQPQRSLDFAKGFNVEHPIATDPDSKLMGLFGVYSMPATFIVDRQGVIRFMDTGFKPEEQAARLRQTIEDLLK